mmetsp:Transcript_96621/g.174486  ORF Transcript_96621/g.174486 Transcript_96621/m.174486 type:complete len:159 (-) Transcript_96621:122-598(-)
MPSALLLPPPGLCLFEHRSKDQRLCKATLQLLAGKQLDLLSKLPSSSSTRQQRARRERPRRRRPGIIHHKGAAGAGRRAEPGTLPCGKEEQNRSLLRCRLPHGRMMRWQMRQGFTSAPSLGIGVPSLAARRVRFRELRRPSHLFDLAATKPAAWEGSA